MKFWQLNHAETCETLLSISPCSDACESLGQRIVFLTGRACERFVSLTLSGFEFPVNYKRRFHQGPVMKSMRKRQSVSTCTRLHASTQPRYSRFHNIDATGQGSRCTGPTQIAPACRLPVGTDCYLHMYKTLLERERGGKKFPSEIPQDQIPSS